MLVRTSLCIKKRLSQLVLSPAITPVVCGCVWVYKGEGVWVWVRVCECGCGCVGVGVAVWVWWVGVGGEVWVEGGEGDLLHTASG